MAKYKAINTFSQKPSVTQIASYIIFLTQILIFAIIIQVHYTQQKMRITMIIIQSIVTFIQVVITLLTSLSDPSDSFMIRYRNDRDQVRKTDVSNFLYCEICRSYVQRSSRHCRACARCVENFDHHCVWINNCIGGKNYRLFIAMISINFLSMVIWVISASLLWSQKSYNNYLAEMGLVWGCGILVLIFIVLLFMLILLHVYINYLGVTTYQLVTQDRQKTKQVKTQQQLTHQAVLQANKLRRKQFQQQIGQQKLQCKQENNITSLEPQIKQQKQQITKKISQNQLIDNPIIQNIQQITEKYIGNKNYNSSQVKMNKIFPDSTGVLVYRQQPKQSILYEEDSKSQLSERQSIKISQFFTRNRSLKILVSNDAFIPGKIRKQIYPNTCSNARQLNKNKNSLMNSK